MTNLKFDKDITALLVIDPYIDFISDGGKLWDRLKTVAEANHCVPHTLQVLSAARKAELRMFYAQHHRYRPGDYETWKYVAPIQKAVWLRKTFENGTWGGEIRREFEPQSGEIVDQEHWGSSGFANTDLDLQLKKHGIHQLIVMGLIAHTCLESTVRYAAENGYEVPTLHTSAIVGPLPLGLVQSRLKTRRHECVRRIRARQKDVELAKSGQGGVGQGFVRRHCFFGFRRGLGNGVGHS
jgi:ureidoacrylate peracid hydrolase